MVLVFGECEVVLHGLNLVELWDNINSRNLIKVWELPADYVPPATLSKRRVCIFKIELRDTATYRPVLDDSEVVITEIEVRPVKF
ncbi:MAG TPA: hypothetical protein VNU49_10295 [Opitutaceae bacterium]|nr:hypothetical protein [Opitutaceae bacterium]